MGVIQYDSNNSGGGWWLTDDDWRALEEAGWTVHWIHDIDDPSHTHGDDARASLFGAHRHAYEDEHLLTKVTPSGERWLDALATSAAKATDDPSAAVSEWERVTGKSASDEGCNCCGPPHGFTFTDDEGNSKYSSVEVTRTELRWG